VSLADLLVLHRFDDDKALLHTLASSMTAGEARDAASSTAAQLRDRGVRPGQPIAVQLPNAPEMVTTMFGVWLADAVFVPINSRAPEAEVERTVRAVDAAALIRPDGTRTLDGSTECAPDAAFVQWTSGTTGEPKAILHTHSAYLELLDRVLGELRPAAHGAERTPAPNLIPVSLALNAGIYNVLFGLRAGAAIVIMERFDTRSFAQLVRRFDIRSTVLPPAAITMLTEDETIGDLAPLRYVRSITAPLSPIEAHRFADRFGVVVLNGYGQAEIGEVIGWTAADARAHPQKLGAVGRPHPGVQIKLVGDDGNAVPEGGVGELAVRPPKMASGYLGGDESSALGDRLDAGGYLRTGDLARVDTDGFVWIEGRVGDVINRGGNKVFPAQVEEVLRRAPGVRDAAVVGAPDDRLGEVPVAFFVGDADPNALESECRDQLTAYKVPAEFHRVDALPRNEVGKLLRGSLVAAERANGRLAVGPDTSIDDVVGAVSAWIDEHVPASWRAAARRGGAAAIREVRSRAEYKAWYPVFARSGLVVPTWPAEYGGLDLGLDVARRVETELQPYNLGRLNPLGLNLAAPALFAYGTEEQRRRFLPPIVRNEEKWCQLFSEPGAGSDLASLTTTAVRDGAEWVVTGQKVWTTWAHVSDYAVLLARTDPDAPKRKGITYFVLDLHQPGVDVRPLRHLGGDIDFNEVFLDRARVPDAQRVGQIGDGWRVAGATLSGERQMVAGEGSGGVDRIGGSGVSRLLDLARGSSHGDGSDPVVRQELMRVYSEERIRAWTNERVRARVRTGRAPGAESSIGKVHQGDLNQRIQLLAVRLLGMDAVAWASPSADYGDALPFEVRGMLRSRANTIEGGTTEVNKNVLGERVLGLPREPDPWQGRPWRDIPRG
jgi:acyl-CoA synthetase (AMP-forming)/AMP-acid ligase II/alkylation response protein AidB-like acyl-CoA dehydrogenase